MANINELIRKLAEDTTPVKPAHHPALLSLEWVVVGVFYLAVAVMISGVRSDLSAKLHETWFIAEMIALAAIFVTTSLSAALLSFPDLHQLRRMAYVPAFAFAAFVLMMFFALGADQPPSRPPMHSVECTLSITMLAVIPAVWIFLVMRRFASTHHYWAGSIALLCAFSVGALWIRLYEQTDSIMHVIEWHYLPMLLIGLIGMFLGKLVLRW